MHKAGIGNQDKILCTINIGPSFFFLANFWQGQDSWAFDFSASFFVDCLGPEMSSFVC